MRICIKRVGEAAKLGINVCFRKLRFVVFNRHRKANEGRSLFCNNCVGALVLHDYGLRFDAPTVNLFIHPKDFVEMLSHLGAYMQADMERHYQWQSLSGRLAGRANTVVFSSLRFIR